MGGISGESSVKVRCGSCNSSLLAKAKLSGKQAKCPKCGAVIDIPEFATTKPSTHKVPPATERQKDYAESLGIDFPEDIDRKQISALIDNAVRKEDQERDARLCSLSRREGEAWDAMRKEVAESLGPEELPLSLATPDQIAQALCERGLATVLVTIPWDQIEEFTDLTGVQISISHGEEMEFEDMKKVITALAVNFMGTS